MRPRARALAVLLACIAFGVFGCRAPSVTPDAAPNRPAIVTSPDGRTQLSIEVRSGTPTYSVRFAGKTVLTPSPMGLQLSGKVPLGRLEIADVRLAKRDTIYALPVGKTSRVRDRANTATITLREKDSDRPRRIEIDVRVYDDGVAFRYRVPAQATLSTVTINSEETVFAPPAHANAWALPLPSINSHYEFGYLEKNLGQLPAGQLVGLPLLIHTPDGPWAAITEAGLDNYAGMALLPDASTAGVLHAGLAPRAGTNDVTISGQTPLLTPWRVILLGDTLAPVIESNIVTSLNAPSRVPDTSWIKPGKVSFLWWNGYVAGLDGQGEPIRGSVDTATCIKYVDFAADNGIPYASLDGLDVAWYGGPLAYNGQDLTAGHAPHLDVQAVLAHAKVRGVRIRLWIDSKALRPQLDRALDAFERWGVEGIMVDFIEREDQETVRWITEVAQKAAAHHLTVSLHNVSKPTGLSRTYPNLLTYEAVRNAEYNKFPGSMGSTPRHELIVPFTRMLAGPLDFHSGGFRSVLSKDFAPHDLAPVVMGTRAHQLAMYVVYEDPLPMVVDFPEAYRDQPEFKMLTEIPTVWDQTKFITGDVGESITIARRKDQVWYVGSMAGDEPRRYRVPLTFLDAGRYTIDGWRDGPADQPNHAVREPTREVTREDFVDVEMSPAGGQIVRLRPVMK